MPRGSSWGKDVRLETEGAEMTLLTAQLTVEDVEAFLEIHRANDVLRREYRCTSARALRSAHDPHVVLVLLEFPTAQVARAYVSAAIQEGGLDRATVSGLHVSRRTRTGRK
jgi:hypothetical protein